jgi:hypothetical protein
MLCCFITASAQDRATVTGVLTDEEKRPIPYVSVGVVGTGIGGATDSVGVYSLSVPSNQSIKLAFSHVRFAGQTFELVLRPGRPAP